jgi:hypothetical protein
MPPKASTPRTRQNRPELLNSMGTRRADRRDPGGRRDHPLAVADGKQARAAIGEDVDRLLETWRNPS